MERCNLFKLNESEQYMSLLQETILRMATNSSNCKTWMLAIVSAMMTLFLAKDGNKQEFIYALLPTIVLYLLDCYYLGLEKYFREVEKEYVSVAGNESKEKEMVYKFKATKEKCDVVKIYDGIKSLSTTPFYTIVSISIVFLSGVKLCFC